MLFVFSEEGISVRELSQAMLSIHLSTHSIPVGFEDASLLV